MPITAIFRAAIIALLPMVSTITPSLAEDFDHLSRIGIVHLDKAGAPVLDIPSTNAGKQAFLEAGTEISVVISAPGGAQRLVQAKTAGTAVIVPPGGGQLIRDDANGDTARYKLVIVGGSKLQPGAMGFGLAGVADICGASNSVVSCDLEPGGAPQSFRVCASREGLHFSVWSGKPLEGARRWHAYYYLGYDVEPDCTDRDYAK